MLWMTSGVAAARSSPSGWTPPAAIRDRFDFRETRNGMPGARESPQTLCSVFAGYGLAQTSWPSAVITILPGMPIWSASTNDPPSPGRGFT